MKGVNSSLTPEQNNISSASAQSMLLNSANPNQGRTFNPLLGFFLLNVLAKAVTAKYASFLPYQFSYDPTSWWTYNKPSNVAPWSSNGETYAATTYPDYKPTYSNSYQSYPTLTTSLPNFLNKPPSAYEAYDDYEYPEERRKYRHVDKSITYNDLVPAESNINTNKHRSSSRYSRKRPSKRNKYSQKRRRTTTPPAYYDSYEDYSTEKYINRRRRPSDRDSNESYEDYYDSTENINKKRRPTRNKNKNQQKRRDEINRDDSEFSEFDSNTQSPQTEIVIFRQAMTTTEPTTLITNGTTVASDTTTTAASNVTSNSTSYGYGPSNGNEGISITYGPPPGRYQYSAPYIDWYNNDGSIGSRNSIVKRVREVVNFDKQFNVK